MRKNTSKKNNVTLILCIFSLLIVGLITAYFIDILIINNSLKTGIVNIEINEYSLDGRILESNQYSNVLPGQILNKIEKINVVNGADDCYVRVKIELEIDGDIMQVLPQYLDIDQNNWLYKNEYYYYKKILKKTDEPIQIFSKLKIPSDISSEYALKEGKLIIKADAIQTKNMEVDLSGNIENPWKDISDSDIIEYTKDK